MSELHAVHGGDFFQAIGERFDQLQLADDVVSADVLDAWYDPAPSVIESIRAHLPWLIKTSPPTHAEGLREVIAETRGVSVQNLLVGSGSSSLIFILFPQLYTGKRVAILDPTYGEYAHVLQTIGAEVVRIPLPRPSFEPELDQGAEAIKACDGFVLVNPNSPTGVGLERAWVQELLNRTPESCTVWIDETYIDFMPGAQSCEPLVAQHPNLIISKSMSKYYALSGLRIGYLVASTAIVQEAERHSPPWSVGLIAQLAGIRALEAKPYYETRTEMTLRYAAQLSSALTNLGMQVAQPSANYVFAHLPGGGVANLCQHCAGELVYIRNCDSLSPTFQDDYLRVAVKEPHHQSRVIDAFESFFRSR